MAIPSRPNKASSGDDQYDPATSIVAAEVNADFNTIYNAMATIDNSNISAGANIAYTKLNLSGQIDNGDISATADITASKLLDGSITSDKIGADQVTRAKIPDNELTLTAYVESASTEAVNNSSDLLDQELTICQVALNLTGAADVFWWWNVTVDWTNAATQSGSLSWYMRLDGTVDVDSTELTSHSQGFGGTPVVNTAFKSMGRATLMGMLPAVAQANYTAKMFWNIRVFGSGAPDWVVNSPATSEDVTPLSSLSLLAVYL